MKFHIPRLLLATISVLGFASASPIPPPITPTPMIPESLNLAPALVKAYALTQITRATCTSFEEINGKTNVLGTLNLTMTPIKELDDLAVQVGAVKMKKFTVQDPRRTIHVQWTFFSKDAPVFESYSGFQLIKKNEGGKVSYEKPWYAPWIHLSFLGIEIPVSNVLSAKLLSSETGNSQRLNVTSRGIYVTPEMLNDPHADTFEFVFKNGSVVKYDRVGSIVKSTLVELTFANGVSVDGIVHIEGYNSQLDIQFSPEGDYNPAVETLTDDSGQLELKKVRSEIGFEPMFVHITTMEDLSQRVPAEVEKYYDGLKIENVPGENFIIWFEFDPSIRKMPTPTYTDYEYVGKKG